MLSQELRIGNWIKTIPELNPTAGEAFQVTPELLLDIAVMERRRITPPYQFIRLTKEWLTSKLGFWEDIEFEGDIRYIHESTMLYELKNTSTLESGFVIQCCASTRKGTYIISEPLGFVHELQNAHFNMTRQELQIKEA